MREFDLIVVGSGSGLDVAVGAAQHGMKVAVIEKGPLGGTCLNRGCIPSKILIQSAEVAQTIDRAHLFGIKAHGYEVDFPAVVKRATDPVDHDSEEIERNLREAKNPMLFKEEGRFISHKTIRVGNETLHSEKILIASGLRPKVPNIVGLEESGFITSDEALRLKEQPKVLTVLGGGYIAAELAHFFGALGTKVNIVQRHKVLLNREDDEISERFTEIFRQKHNVFTDFEPVEVSRDGKDFRVKVKKVNGEETNTLTSDQLLVAVGRTPNSDLIDVEKTGVKVDGRGFIVTDEYLETNVKGIFALGDAVGHYLYRHSANLEADYVSKNLIHGQRVAVDYTAMPHAVFTSPQVAAVGKTEQELKASNVDHRVGRYNYYETAKGRALEDRTGFVKILVDVRTAKILGCHIIGTEASSLIHEVVVAMKSGDGTIDNITNAIHIHPALNEVVQRAAYQV